MIDALAAEGILPKKIRFFGATAKVTGRNSVGSIEGLIGGGLHSKEAIQILKDVNKILFESNMKVISRLMNNGSIPIMREQLKRKLTIEIGASQLQHWIDGL